MRAPRARHIQASRRAAPRTPCTSRASLHRTYHLVPKLKSRARETPVKLVGVGGKPQKQPRKTQAKLKTQPHKTQAKLKTQPRKTQAKLKTQPRKTQAKLKTQAYPAAKKAQDPSKLEANRIIQDVARGCSKALILDTRYLTTTKNLLSVGVAEIVAPQLCGDEYHRMCRAVSKLPGRVQVLHSSMAEAIQHQLPRMLGAPAPVLVWHDAMCTWNCDRSTGTELSHDYQAIVDTYANTPCTNRLVCALSVCTRGLVRSHHGSPLANHMDNIYRDIPNIAYASQVATRFLSIHRYPSMILFVLELRKFEHLLRDTPVCLGQRVRVHWDKHPEWRAGYYPGVVQAVCGDQVKVSYMGEATYDWHRREQVIPVETTCGKPPPRASDPGRNSKTQ